jgi:predicted DNA-binding protein
MKQKLYSLTEAEKLSGRPKSTIRKWAIEHNADRIGINYVLTVKQIEEIKKIPLAGKFTRTGAMLKNMSAGQKKRRGKE